MAEYSAPVSNNEALADLEAGKIAESLAALREQVWRDPSYKSLCNVAAAERAAGEFEAARDHLNSARRIDSRSPVAWFNMANVDTDCGNFDRALGLYAFAWERGNGNKQIALGYAQALLRERRFAEAWPLWELGRLEWSWLPLPGTRPWHPTLSPGHVLAMCEGGYGDAFLYSRWLPFIKQSGAAKVTLMIWRCLLDWTDWRALGVDEVVAKEDGISPEGIDYTTSWMSLPVLAGMRSMKDLPWPEPWLWSAGRPMPRAATNRIGFCWTAAEQGLLRKIRTLDDDTASRVGRYLENDLDNAWCLSLVPGASPCMRFSTLARDISWRDTTAQIQSLDYVVSTDTAVAHLSALCGIPTLILLPCNSDWKWGRDSLTDEWYGPHVRYYRNRDPLKWDVDVIKRAIEEMIRCPSA
jgi:hypothetical protein